MLGRFDDTGAGEESNAIPGRGRKKRCWVLWLQQLKVPERAQPQGLRERSWLRQNVWLELENTISFGETSNDDSSLHPSPVKRSVGADGRQVNQANEGKRVLSGSLTHLEDTVLIQEVVSFVVV